MAFTYKYKSHSFFLIEAILFITVYYKNPNEEIFAYEENNNIFGNG